MKLYRKTPLSPQDAQTHSSSNEFSSLKPSGILQSAAHHFAAASALLLERSRHLRSMACHLAAASALLLERSRHLRSEPHPYKLARYLFNIQEEERKRIARELHDDVGQRIALMKIELEIAIQKDPFVQNGAAGPHLVAIVAQLEELSVDVQHLSHTLHSSKLRYLGLKAALKDLCVQTEKQWGLAIELQAADLATPVAKEIEFCIYRVAQEALHNIIKHSRADHIRVTLLDAGTMLRMEIRDNGKGFRQARNSAGLGLASMRERLSMVGGYLQVMSHPGHGTLLVAHAPFAIPVKNKFIA